MSALSYVVVPSEGCWKLRHQGYDAGAFKSEDDALREAIGLAREASSCGHEARVVVQERGGARREAWPHHPEA